MITVTAGLLIKYLNFIFNFKNLTLGVLPDLKNQNLLNILKLVHEYTNITDILLNICIAIHLYLTLSFTITSCERSFTKFELIKTYLGSTMN